VVLPIDGLAGAELSTPSISKNAYTCRHAPGTAPRPPEQSRSRLRRARLCAPTARQQMAREGAENAHARRDARRRRHAPMRTVMDASSLAGVSSTQCAAVSTVVGVMSEPPQR
jgi:hypothetical protein